MFNWKTKTDEQVVKMLESNHSRLRRRRELYEDLWSLVVKVFRPRRYDILGDKEKGEQFGADVYDQAPANALNKFVSGLIGYMVSRSVPWLQFVASDRKLMEVDDVKQYCQEAAEQVLYAAGRSNFYSAMTPHALDAHSIGTSIQIPMLDEMNDRVVFDVAHPRDSYIATDRFGNPHIYHRELRLTRMTAVETFGKDPLPKDWFDKDELKDPFSEASFLWTIYPNADYDEESLLSEDKKYMVLCVLRGRTAKKSRLVYKRGRDAFVTCWRTGRDSGADYGTSIASECLTAALVTNKLGEKAVAAAHLAVERPIIASKSLRRSLYTNPGSRTFVDDIQREGAKTWMDRIDWPITDAQMDRLHKQIEERMFIRFFEMLSTGDLKARTAYEVSQMMGEKATLMTTIVDTCEQDSLEPDVDVLIRAETDAGRMPPPPEELMLSGGRVDIRYLGPLAQLQRSLLRSKGVIDALSIIKEMMEMAQHVGWKFNWLEMAEEVTVNQGLPQKFIASDETVQMLAQDAARKEQMAEQAQMLEIAGKAAPGLGRAIEPKSPVAALLPAGAE
jgi:hypothetical protein